MTTTDSTGSLGWSWHLQRALSIVLVVALPLWLLGWLVVPDFGALTIVDLRQRWTNPLWRGVDLVVVVAGLVHAALLSRPLVERRVSNETVRLVLEGAVWAATAGLLFGALRVIVTLGV
jgi:succinate dehydrogenase hydrophobic anchor subunit